MKKKWIWGLGILTVCIIHTFLFVVVNQNAKKLQLKTDLVEIQKMLEKHHNTANTAKAIDSSNVQQTDEKGFKLVRQGDHWHKVPITEFSDR